MKVKFIGATHEVTGSCTFIEVADKRYIVDYGMRQGREIFEFQDLPVKPSQLDGIFLTHAHIDHSGMLPKLYKYGFRGTVYCTGATLDLCRIMLKDSAHILESEAEWKNRKLERRGLKPNEPEYSSEDAEAVIGLFRGFNYGKIIKVNENVQIRFSDIGHLLGSSCIEIWLTEKDVTKKILFSGDVGNKDHPIICDPISVEEGCEYLVIESTYGNRLHEDDDKRDPYRELADCIQRAFDRGGNVVIPSFAVGRTQELLYIIKCIKEQGLVQGHDHFPVYIDSPLAVEATNVFDNCDHSYFDEKMLALIEEGINPLMNDDLKFSVSTEESKMINFEKTSKVIISSSGMCEAGRIRHHLKHNLWSAKNVILFVGYQAEGSLGRALLDGKDSVKLFGDEIIVKAEICSMHGTSGHADKQGLLNWIDSMKEKPKVIFVNHGEAQSCEDFKDTLIGLGFNAIAPYSGCEFDLISQIIKESKPIYSEKDVLIDTKAKFVFNELEKSVEELKVLAKSLKGHENREIEKLTAKINQILKNYQ